MYFLLRIMLCFFYYYSVRKTRPMSVGAFWMSKGLYWNETNIVCKLKWVSLDTTKPLFHWLEIRWQHSNTSFFPHQNIPKLSPTLFILFVFFFTPIQILHFVSYQFLLFSLFHFLYFFSFSTKGEKTNVFKWWQK